MSDPATEQKNLRSLKAALARKEKTKFTDAEINEIQRIAERNPEALREIPAIAGLQNALGMAEAGASAATSSGQIDRGLNEQYSGVFKGVQKLNLPVMMLAQGIARASYIKGRGAKGATELLSKRNVWTTGEVVLASLITMFVIAALYNLSTSPNFTAALVGGFYGIPNALVIATILFLAVILVRRRRNRLQ